MVAGTLFNWSNTLRILESCTCVTNAELTSLIRENYGFLTSTGAPHNRHKINLEKRSEIWSGL